jgi:hypothetical protein
MACECEQQQKSSVKATVYTPFLGVILPWQALVRELSFPDDGLVGYSAILSRFSISLFQIAVH